MTAETDKSKTTAPGGTDSGALSRRSSRVTIAIPVTIYGKGSDNKMFMEDTVTTAVNAHGGLMTINGFVSRHETVLLRNGKTGIEVTGRIVYCKDADGGGYDIGVEFVEPTPRFWGISFPPEDWDKSTRKRPTRRP